MELLDVRAQRVGDAFDDGAREVAAAIRIPAGHEVREHHVADGEARGTSVHDLCAQRRFHARCAGLGLRSFGEQCGRGPGRVRAVQGREASERVTDRPGVALEHPEIAQHVMTLPTTCIGVCDGLRQHHLDRGRRAGNDGEIAVVEGAHAQQPALRIRAALGNRNAGADSEIHGRAPRERAELAARLSQRGKEPPREPETLDPVLGPATTPKLEEQRLARLGRIGGHGTAEALRDGVIESQHGGCALPGIRIVGCEPLQSRCGHHRHRPVAGPRVECLAVLYRHLHGLGEGPGIAVRTGVERPPAFIDYDDALAHARHGHTDHVIGRRAGACQSPMGGGAEPSPDAVEVGIEAESAAARIGPGARSGEHLAAVRVGQQAAPAAPAHIQPHQETLAHEVVSFSRRRPRWRDSIP